LIKFEIGSAVQKITNNHVESFVLFAKETQGNEFPKSTEKCATANFSQIVDAKVCEMTKKKTIS
jgi:hypothetical protein